MQEKDPNDLTLLDILKGSVVMGAGILLIMFSLMMLTGCTEQDINKAIDTARDAQQAVKDHPDLDDAGQQEPTFQQTRDNDTIRIASFNLEVFGKTKAGRPETMDILADTITRYDIVAVQEIRDKSGTAIEALEQEIDSRGTDYNVIIGPRLGRTQSKEQYAYIYNPEKILVKGRPYTYPDPEDDIHREPHVAYFTTREGSFDFVLLNIHVDPDEAHQEIAALEDALNHAKERYTTPDSTEEDFIILGDLNADCRYWDEGSHAPLEDLHWLIDNSMDTNVADSSCTYDRIIATSTDYYAGNSGVFRFDQYFDLSEEETDDVSDHYPVWVEFNINADRD